MEILSECPVCGGKEYKDALICKDYTVSNESFNIVCCDDCSFLFTNPRPDKSEIGRYYKSSAYISHSDSSKGLVNQVYKLVRRLTVASKYKLIKPYLSKPVLLDIGAGTGYFLKFCQEKGNQVYGIEPDSDARSAAYSLHQMSLKEEAELSNFNAGSIPVITMWHVLEHVHDLTSRIQEIERLLIPGGKLIVAVPNHRSYDAQYYREFWAAYDVPRHLYHFDPDSIERLFSKFGFTLEAIKPMCWDAFYVSLLSERYKTGRPGLFSAIFRGLASNLRAGGNKYSSQIYILSKSVV